MKDSILIYSGGMDSTTLLHHRKDTISLAISFDYGSKHNDIEFKYAQENTKLLGIEHIRIDLKPIMSNFKSNLFMGSGSIPEGHYSDESMATTVVPFRNGIMLSIAAGIAESKGLNKVLVASHFGDDAQYPDCRETFINPMTEAISNGTSNNVKLVAPYTYLTKDAIAEIGNSLHIDWSTTYSCYNGQEKHCGRCGTCVERIWALKNSIDYTIYEDYNYAVEVLKEKGDWNDN